MGSVKGSATLLARLLTIGNVIAIIADAGRSKIGLIGRRTIRDTFVSRAGVTGIDDHWLTSTLGIHLFGGVPRLARFHRVLLRTRNEHDRQ